ncbi:UPF0598 protein C8orf82 [Varanus komodoensis]|uniref:Chromosome 8 open reading frame 82 n=1 Tax=Varanus komodoensis TaxID=61221 RepID=A0A8D2LQK8_VARKO|nr:UPF0598 protein C8orf82 homolog [Varanus komodoensis]KAF7237171.1 UPF0598 protein C8orf82 [Varanus komodoensis]
MRLLRAGVRLLPQPGTRRGPGRPLYQQGQSPSPRTREYFYYVDHQGQLFLDDAKVKNFITCFKDKQFLVFFFKQLRLNRSGRYEDAFPYLSPCGREHNYVRCDDRPIVFTQLLQGSHGEQLLSYCGGAEGLAVPFQPEKLAMLPENGRVYHPGPEKAGGVGLVKSALAFELSPCFAYERGPTQPPTHFQWQDKRHVLTHELLPCIRDKEEGP